MLIALRRPDDEGYAGEPIELRVEPGAAVTLRALVRNQSGIVDNYDMTVDGLPEGWWEVAPATVYLVPFGAAGGSYEQEVEVRLAPPRAPEAEARAWEVVVVATSRANGTQVRSAPSTLEIAPYSELEAALTPERRSGRIEAAFTLALTNRANAPVEVALSGVDPEEALGFEFREPFVPAARRTRDPLDRAESAWDRAEALGVGQAGVEEIGKRAVQRATAGAEGTVVRILKRRRRVGRRLSGVRLAPGERAEAVVAVSPPKQIWIGRSVMHPFQVVARPAGADVPGPPVAGTFRQRQWLPWWLMIVVPLVVVAGIWFLSTRGGEATVPDLAPAPDVFAAKALLEDSGLTLGETFEEAAPDAEPGAIIEQTPAAGETAAEGSEVSIKVAVAPERAAVPDLTGQTTEQARATLTAAGFQLGRPLNEPADPATAAIANQIPVPDTVEATGAAIDVAFAEADGDTVTAPTGAPPPSTAPGGAPTAPAPTPTAPGGAPPPPATAPTPAPAPGGPVVAPVPVPAGGAPPPQPAPPAPGGGVPVPEVVGTGQDEASAVLTRAPRARRRPRRQRDRAGRPGRGAGAGRRHGGRRGRHRGDHGLARLPGRHPRRGRRRRAGGRRGRRPRGAPRRLPRRGGAGVRVVRHAADRLPARAGGGHARRRPVGPAVGGRPLRPALGPADHRRGLR
nr:PASTA domain-containing protein [Miltoncostaea marina]